MEARQNPPFTAFSGTERPDMATFSSIIASLLQGSATTPDLSPPSVPATSTSDSVVDVSSTQSEQHTPTTFSTLPSSSQSSSLSTATSTSFSSSQASRLSTETSSATSVASSSGATSSESETCHSISCSAGLKAAIAVPVVVGVLAIIGLVVFVGRKRRRNRQSSDITKEKPKKHWTRHLRIFSFDNELLGGGRFSSSNSMRSGESNQHIAANPRPEDPSVHSIDEAAPPYVSHAQPNMTQTGSALAAGAIAGAALPRSTSRASAPPPYGPTENRPTSTPTTPVAGARNPFSDSQLAVPNEHRSPFGDPSEDGRSTTSRPAISRNSSMISGLQQDDVSAVGSEAGSIREAQVARHVSVASGRITNVRLSSHSPASSD